jgi:sugar O-acyltransferase (sialic acid O-acetyltransferase NeuD family)
MKIHYQKKICVVGTGGFGRETMCCLIDSLATQNINAKDVASFMVADKDFDETLIMGLPVIPQSEFNPEEYEVLVGIGDSVTRKKVVENLPVGTKFTTVIHPSAVISDWVEIGEGGIITAGVIITCNIKIGKHAQLNLHSTVGHDCVIGDYYTSGPGTNVSGICTFGHNVYFGTNASVKQGISICDNVVIGMGSVVTKNITEPGVYIGSPVKKLEK